MPARKESIDVYSEVLFLIGLPLVSLGTVLMAKSALGNSVTSSVPYALWHIWPQLSWGTWTYGFQTVLILTLVVLLRRFKPSYVISYGVALAFSVLIDLFNRMLGFLTVEGLLQRCLSFGSGLLVIQIGVALMVFSSLPLMPLDLFVRELAHAWNMPFGRLKWATDVSYIVIAALLMAFVLRDWVGIGLGTLIAAAVNGPAIGFWIRKLKSRIMLKSLIG